MAVGQAFMVEAQEVQDGGVDVVYMRNVLGGTQADGAPLARAFSQFGAPFAVLDVRDKHARDVYGHDLILLRPDLHIVWRGNSAPAEPTKLAAIATGHQLS